MDGAAGSGGRSSDWRELIRAALDVIWPSLADGPAWIEAQVAQESGGDPRALSPAGAQGLLQLMPATAAELRVANPFDPAENLHGGITYLRRQYEALDQVPEHLDRLLWSLASFNAGRGYIARALGLAEMDKRLPGAERWWVWDLSWRYLPHREAQLRGRWADYHQVVAYVGRIRARAVALGAAR